MYNIRCHSFFVHIYLHVHVMFDSQRLQRHFSLPIVGASVSLQLPLVDKPLYTSLEDFASVGVLLGTSFRLP